MKVILKLHFLTEFYSPTDNLNIQIYKLDVQLACDAQGNLKRESVVVAAIFLSHMEVSYCNFGFF